MHKIYRDGSVIGDVNGRVLGGSTVLAEKPEDLDALLALCVECRERSLNAISGWMSRFDTWLEWFEANRQRYLTMTEQAFETRMGDKHPDTLSDVERLMLGLYLAREIWKTTPTADADALRVMASVSAGGAGLNYEAEVPALYFYQGSLQAAFTPFVPFIAYPGLFAMGLGLYGVAMVVRMGSLPSIQAEKLVEDLREAAKPNAQVPDLPRLDQLDAKAVQGKKGVIIVLHGLFSTDLGTFDGFIKQWKEPPEDLIEAMHRQAFLRQKSLAPTKDDFREAFDDTMKDYLIVGWPHNTLTKIDNNARDLFDDIVKKLGPNGPPIVFVCHSRGGLLARKTAVIMQKKDQQDGKKGDGWADKVKLCVTFGTPHRGADLAEHPLTFVAAYIAIMNGTRNVLSAARVLAIYQPEHHFEGIEDLVPEDAGGEFLGSLRDKERDFAPNSLRKLDIMAVGSIYEGQKWFQRSLITGILGTPKHDLVVRTVSAVPETFDDGEITHCGHGEYFDHSEVSKSHFKKVVDRIRAILKVEEAMRERVTVEPLTDFDPSDILKRF